MFYMYHRMETSQDKSCVTSQKQSFSLFQEKKVENFS